MALPEEQPRDVPQEIIADLLALLVANPKRPFEVVDEQKVSIIKSLGSDFGAWWYFTRVGLITSIGNANKLRNDSLAGKGSRSGRFRLGVAGSGNNSYTALSQMQQAADGFKPYLDFSVSDWSFRYGQLRRGERGMREQRRLCIAARVQLRHWGVSVTRDLPPSSLAYLDRKFRGSRSVEQ